ncbi:hypothetical protein HanHA300_Chr17g0666181 [Helianthus annuus]|nr:hypothetical protein HanHA300_Chr17g0666181 [Helianthus annuus]
MYYKVYNHELFLKFLKILNKLTHVLKKRKGGSNRQPCITHWYAKPPNPTGLVCHSPKPCLAVWSKIFSKTGP